MSLWVFLCSLALIQIFSLMLSEFAEESLAAAVKVSVLSNKKRLSLVEEFTMCTPCHPYGQRAHPQSSRPLREP
jgi:hypothetical protein